jgi:hypothetical protein
MKLIAFVVVLCSIVACGPDSAKQSVNRDTLTQRQKDSILAHSRIPNARAVGRAMTVADSTSAGALRIDSVARDTTEF